MELMIEKYEMGDQMEVRKINKAEGVAILLIKAEQAGATRLFQLTVQ